MCTNLNPFLEVNYFSQLNGFSPLTQETTWNFDVLVYAALVVYLPKPKIDKRKKLWSKNEEGTEQEAAEVLSCAFATVLRPCMFGEEK